MEPAEVDSSPPRKRMSMVLDEVKARSITNPRSYRHNESRQSVSTEYDLVIDDDFNESKSSIKSVNITEKTTDIICQWEHCCLQFADYGQYVLHMQNHADETPIFDDYYNCGLLNCNFQSPCSEMFLKHVIFHAYHEKLKNIGEKVALQTNLPKCRQPYDFEVPIITTDYECEWEFCSMVLRTIYEFLLHVGNHVFANPHVGSIHCGWKNCSTKVNKKCNLSDHMRSHTNEKAVACFDCGTMFASKMKFKDHCNRQMAKEFRTFQCSECSKLFPTENILRDHMRAHVNFYKCNLCDMTCSKPSNLAKHIRTRHLDDRPFKCQLCTYRSVTHSQLRSHMLTHIQEDLFRCEMCDFKCRSQRTLDNHQKDKHGDGIPRLYKCHCCNARYIRGRPLTLHLIKKHGYTRPPGHSMFRYKRDLDGFYKLKTLRYESLEITNEMASQKEAVVKYDLKQTPSSTESQPSYVLMVSETGEENIVCPTSNEIIITIDDVDAKGHVVKSQVVQSNEIVNADVQCMRNADENAMDANVTN